MGESIVYAIKCALVAVAVGLFITATTTLFSLVVSFSYSTIVGEVIGIISMCLPFATFPVANSMLSAFDAILLWVVARKLFSMTRKGVEST